MENQKQFQFQVNMKGMIELLSEHIYSSPTVFVRELLQNGMDAVTVRKGIDESFKGKIDITFEGDRLIFQDNGVGLTQDDVHQFLSVIGQSSKRGELADKDLIGKFGIGLLSCLVVSEAIVVESRSLYKEESVRWTGKADGTYEVEMIPLLDEVGTKVILDAKKAWRSLFKREEVKQNVLFYGSALPIEVNLIENGEVEQFLDGNPVWLDNDSSKEQLLQYGKEVFKTRFLDVFRLYSEAGEIQGVAYIIPNKVNTTATKEHKIFLKKMYLCDQATNLLPEWTSFVRCIINSNELQPTASRESLMNNSTLQEAKKELSDCFKEYLKTLSITNPEVLEKIISIHHMFIKALAASDNEIMTMFEDYLPFETNQGLMSFGEIKETYKNIYYTPSLDDYRQIRRIAGSQNKLVINAAYSYETDLIEKIKRSHTELTLERIAPNDILEEFEDAIDDTKRIEEFIEKANKILKRHFCKAEVKRFEPKDTTAIYIANEDALTSKNIQSLSQTANPFASTLQHFKKKEEVMPTLCFNQQSELVEKVMLIDDEELFEALINVVYVQALMLGGYTINKKEMDTFNDALYQFMILGMSNFLPKF
ncbi:HSP90 family protein [Myroides marinus]|uniref:HSP90 family protein n=1 Tax=Myroides marinus TaxID=703342 RepID=UPI002574E151|nr:HSP90 family protein [Myroides marinus]MDM1371790.1 HSP90 family protein [Myroides marinus]MDM1390052.1 HSP90 family protein [Myroides marinus]MDM1403700.1 HSP90 family protein [Myroides marinus]MDM1534315.1 HSP90 family protein [Myroides marinus]MDM1541269.1 HSP90 family protein [Myroides marinus]